MTTKRSSPVTSKPSARIKTVMGLFFRKKPAMRKSTKQYQFAELAKARFLAKVARQPSVQRLLLSRHATSDCTIELLDTSVSGVVKSPSGAAFLVVHPLRDEDGGYGRGITVMDDTDIAPAIINDSYSLNQEFPDQELHVPAEFFAVFSSRSSRHKTRHRRRINNGDELSTIVTGIHNTMLELQGPATPNPKAKV